MTRSHAIASGYVVLSMMQRQVAGWKPDQPVPNCVSWSDGAGVWKGAGIVADTVSAAPGGDATITCQTYHLSTFATSEAQAPSQLNTVHLLDDFSVLREVCDPFSTKVIPLALASCST